MQKLFGEDVLCHGMPKYQNSEESNLFLSLGRHVDVYFPPRKRSRVIAPFVFCGEMFKKQQTTIDVLPDECLFEVFRRVSGRQEKSACASVSKRWLMLLSTIRKDEICVDQKIQPPAPEVAVPVAPASFIKKDRLFPSGEIVEDDNNGGCLARSIKGKKATDVRLAAIGVGSGSRGGLSQLAVLGNNASKVTDFGLKAVSRGCPTLTSLTLWNLSSIGDEGLVEIANGCPLLENLDLSQCPQISDKSLFAIANNCPNLTSLAIESCSKIGNEGLQAIGRSCLNLKSISIKNCTLIGDQGIASLVSSASCSLTKLRLYGLNIGDMSLAVIGHYGMALIDLSLGGLRNVTEKGFWVMGSGQGLQKLNSFVISSCCGVTDLGLEAVGKGCPNLKEFCVRKSGCVSDNGIVSFAKAAVSLETLLLEECNGITQLGIFGLLVNCGKLKTLSLAKCLGIKNLAMTIPSTFSPCNSLKSFSVRNCPGFGNLSLALLGRVCHQLEHVVLTGLHGITDMGLTSLVQNSEAGLTKVDLSGCVNISDKIVSEISMVHGGTLEVLNLDGCRLITDASVVAISENCLLLRELDVSKSGITNFAIAALACAEQLNLQILSISGCSRVSNKSVPFLKKLSETLVGLNIMQCGGITSNAVGLLEGQIWKCDILV